MRSGEEVALLVALLFKRSDQKRARLSATTLRRLAKRRSIRTAFLVRVSQHLDDLGLILIELERGGYGLIAASTLDGAPAITAKKYLPNEVRGPIKFDAIRKELEQDVSLDDDDDA
ncbi:MAG: hypothetical protein K2X87_25045 [Gemmataceae bacterium]|nr:hypothetical protein [Gemmataceae bacterium]